jgi:hypothetical protein
MTETWRHQKLAQFRQELETQAGPRFALPLIVLLTAVAGFVASAWMLSAGVTPMWLRYPLAVAAAYGVFAGMVWAWRRWRAHDAVPSEPATLIGTPGGRTSAAEGCGIVALFIAVVAFAAALLVWVVSFAPAFLAEFAVDGVLAAALFRRLRGSTGASWPHVAIRRTRTACAVVLVLSAVGGAALQWYAPKAVSIGQAWQYRHGGQ